jgi:choice-of-anchor A domain-containing protein
LLSLTGRIDVGKDADVSGELTAGYDVKVDQRSRIYDHINSGHRVEVKRDAWVGGDITAVDRVRVEAGATVTGTVSEFAGVSPIPGVTSVQFSFEPGTEKVTVEKGANLSRSPEAYGDVKVKQGATLILSGQQPYGQYVFETFQMEKDTQLRFDLANGPVVIDVAENLAFKDGVRLQIVGAGDARGVLFRVAGDKVDLKKEGSYLGTFLAPEAEVVLREDAVLYGALYGKRVDIGQRVGITGMPARDLFALLFVTP